jgi:FkbM family methyltransferase
LTASLAVRRAIVWCLTNVFDPRSIRNGRKIPVVGGLSMLYDCRQLVARIVSAKGEFEPWATDLLRSNLNPGSVVLDIGANIGYFSILCASLVRPGGRVIAVEPLFADSLITNISLNNMGDTVSVVRAAIHDEAESVVVRAPSRHDLASAAIQSDGNGTRVRCVTLDEICSDLDRLDWIKIDIEGAEGHALLSGLQTIDRFHPNILLAWSPPALRRLGTEQADLLALLIRLGYELFSSEEEMRSFSRPASDDWEHTVLATTESNLLRIPGWHA